MAVALVASPRVVNGKVAAIGRHAPGFDRFVVVVDRRPPRRALAQALGDSNRNHRGGTCDTDRRPPWPMRLELKRWLAASPCPSVTITTFSIDIPVKIGVK